MDVAREAVQQQIYGLPFAIAAKEQRTGRGRLGSNWVSPKGNLYTTLAFDPDLKAADRPKISFVLALALYDAIYAKSSVKPELKLKWPNDLLLSGYKIAGLLVEGMDSDVILAGIGVNLVEAPKPSEMGQIRYQASDLSSFVHTTPDVLLGKILERTDHWLSILRTDGFERVRQTWLSRAYGIGKPATVRLPNANISGILTGVDESGSLQLEMADGNMRTVLAGAVFFD